MSVRILSALLFAVIIFSGNAAFAKDAYWHHDSNGRQYQAYNRGRYNPHNEPRRMAYCPPRMSNQVGRHLGVYQPVPVHILNYLGPAPRGHFYSMSGRDVLVISQRDHLIAQIISLFGY